MTRIDPKARRPLLDRWPALERSVRFERVGSLPTPVSELDELARALDRPGAPLYEKRDDLTSPIYGGNKVRTLEVLFGHALDAGATEIWSTGGYGSNHAAASAMHAPRVGLVPGMCVYPQPHSRSALDNLELVLSRTPRRPVTDLPHWSALPLGIWRTARQRKRAGERAIIMEPGGAVPLGALGYVSAALELAEQIEAGELPCPAEIVLPAGSNCTSAGLLVGLSIAAAMNLGFSSPPLLTAVRVTPWPVTIPLRIFRLAVQASELLADLTGDANLKRTRRALSPGFRLLTNHIGRGYGFATAPGREAVDMWTRHAGHSLETTYSGKAGAAFIALARSFSRGPLLFWSTKTSAPRPEVDRADTTWAPARMQRWMKTSRALAE